MSDSIKLVSDQPSATPTFDQLSRDDTSGSDAVYDFTTALDAFRDAVVTIFTDNEATFAALPDNAPEFATAGKTDDTVNEFISNLIAAGKMQELRGFVDEAEAIIVDDDEDDESDDDDEDSDEDESNEEDEDGQDAPPRLQALFDRMKDAWTIYGQETERHIATNGATAGDGTESAAMVIARNAAEEAEQELHLYLAGVAHAVDTEITSAVMKGTFSEADRARLLGEIDPLV